MRAKGTALRKPLALSPGARVALVAPAGPLNAEHIARSRARCQALGLEPVVFPAAASRNRFLAGTDAERLGDLQAAFDDRTIDAIWALRGGYGTIRIVDQLDLSRQLDSPAAYIGFSDNTILHAQHAALGVVSFHGPHPGADFPPQTEAAFRRVLFQSSPAGVLRPGPNDPSPVSLVGGRAEGALVGGNLATLASLCGTSLALSAAGKLLFLEDVSEPAYRIDRMLMQLERSGLVIGVVGLAFGRFTSVPRGDYSVTEVLREFAERMGVPAVADLPFGHVPHNWTLPLGVRALLDADAGTLSLEESAVAARCRA